MTTLSPEQESLVQGVVTHTMRAVLRLRMAPPDLYDKLYNDVQNKIYGLAKGAALAQKVGSETEGQKGLGIEDVLSIQNVALDSIFDALRPKVVVKEKLVPLGIPDSEEPIVRETFEEAIRAINFPLKRKGFTYESTYTRHSWDMVFCVINKLKAKLLAIAKEKMNELPSEKEVPEGEGEPASGRNPS